MRGCPFCKRIRRGEVDDDKWGPGVVSFEPLNPVTPGHRLFVPTNHRQNAAVDLPTTGRTFEAAARFGAYGVLDFNLITSAGSAATQTVPHLHVHYVPRRPNDDLSLPWSAVGANDMSADTGCVCAMVPSTMNEYPDCPAHGYDASSSSPVGPTKEGKQ